MFSRHLFDKYRIQIETSNGIVVDAVEFQDTTSEYNPNDYHSMNMNQTIFYIKSRGTIPAIGDYIIRIGDRDLSMNPYRITYIDRANTHITGLIKIESKSPKPLSGSKI
jgi:hypothetical protein